MPNSEAGNAPLHPSPLPTVLNLLLRDTMSSFWSPLSLPRTSFFTRTKDAFSHLVVDFALYYATFGTTKKLSRHFKDTFVWIWVMTLAVKEFAKFIVREDNKSVNL